MGLGTQAPKGRQGLLRGDNEPEQARPRAELLTRHLGHIQGRDLQPEDGCRAGILCHPPDVGRPSDCLPLTLWLEPYCTSGSADGLP